MTYVELYIMNKDLKLDGFVKISLYDIKGVKLVYITRSVAHYNRDKRLIRCRYDYKDDDMKILISKELGKIYNGEESINNFTDDVILKCKRKKRSIKFI